MQQCLCWRRSLASAEQRNLFPGAALSEQQTKKCSNIEMSVDTDGNEGRGEQPLLYSSAWAPLPSKNIIAHVAPSQNMATDTATRAVLLKEKGSTVLWSAAAQQIPNPCPEAPVDQDKGTVPRSRGWAVPTRNPISRESDHDQRHRGRLPCLTGAPPSPPPPHPHPPWTPQPILVSTWLELAIWALAAPGKFFQPGKLAKHLISPNLFTFKMVTMG